MMDQFTGADTVRRRLRRISEGERREEALAFIRQFARENGQSKADSKQREREVLKALNSDGHYHHTAAELAFGARLAWRNHGRCIGRIRWKSLEVYDCRDLDTPDLIAARMAEHMDDAYADGRVGSSISIFSPATPSHIPATIESAQIVQYAGYILPDGTIVGDRHGIEATRTAIQLGWQPPAEPGPHDILPFMVRDEDGRRTLYALPPGVAREVAVTHPGCAGVGALGIRWYAVPCISNMVLTIGGIDYPCAPFSGHYMVTEIASRDLADVRRYDLLPMVADALGLDQSGDVFWRDAALTELNRAVLHSFRAAGISISDHHEESAQYMEFVKQEQRAGRTPSGEWSWIVPPQAPSACPVYHLPMANLHTVPNFYLSRQVDGGFLRLDRSLSRMNRWERLFFLWLDRWRDWRRQRDTIWQRV
jgi:nitric-oxide synthase, bacterial